MGKFVAEHDGLGRLGTTQMLAAVGLQFLHGDAATGREHHCCGDALAPFLIGQTDHARGVDSGMTHEDIFNLGRGDVLAAADDGVISPALDEEVVIGIDPPAIAGGEPAGLVDNTAGVVLTGDLLAAQEHQTGFTDGQHSAILIAHLDLDAGKHLAHRTETDLGHRITLEGRGMILGAEQGDGGGGFGEAIGVHEAGAGEQFQRLFEHGQRHSGAAVGERAQCGQLGGATVEMGDHSGEHGGHDHGLGDTFAAHGIDPDLGVEGIEVHDATAGVEVRQ